jgi:hypothetical protein
MMVAIGDGLGVITSSGNGDDGEDEDDEEKVQGQLSKDDETGWEMDTITQTVQQRMNRFWQKPMNLIELTKPAWEDTANYLRERNKK